MIDHSKIRRLLTGAVAVTTVMALSVPPAGAQKISPDVFAGTAVGQALSLELTGPTGLLKPLGALGNLTHTAGADVSSLRETISQTSNRVNSGGLINAVTKLLEGLLNQGHHTTSAEKSSFSDQIVGQKLLGGVLDVGVGTISAVTDRSKNLTESSSELLDLKVSLAPLLDGTVLGEDTPVVGDIQAALDQLLGTGDILGGGEGDAAEGEDSGTTGVLTGLLGELNADIVDIENAVNQVEGTTGTPVDLPAVGDLELEELTGLLESLDLKEVDLLNVRKMWSDSKVVTEDGKVVSKAISGLAGAKLLGGLVEVPAFEYSSTALTEGEPGTADAFTDVKVIAVKLAGSDLISVTDDTLKIGDDVLDLGQLGVPNSTALLDDLTATLTDILNVVGLSLKQGEGTTRIAEDGSSAFASVSALTLSLKPLHALEGQVDNALTSLGVELAILGNNAGVSAAQVEAKPAPEPAPKPEESLPRTGGGAAAMLIGMLALGGVSALRRRS